MSQSAPRALISFDWAMKNILRDKANFDVLEGFLSTLLQRDIEVLWKAAPKVKKKVFVKENWRLPKPC